MKKINKSSVIKYKHAFDDQEILTNVNTLSRPTLPKGKRFFCISCDGELVPRLGEKRVKHFAHKVEQNCSLETYLHKLGKLRFIEKYQSCLDNGTEFQLKIPFIKDCHAHSDIGLECTQELDQCQVLDLTKTYSDVRVEKKDGQFIPDVLLRGKNGETIFVEIAVFHHSEQEKLDSGNQIIEITLDSEDDLEVFAKNLLDARDPRISIHNFDRHIVQSSNCEKNTCPHTPNTQILDGVRAFSQEYRNCVEKGIPFHIFPAQISQCSFSKIGDKHECEDIKFGRFDLVKFFPILDFYFTEEIATPLILLKNEKGAQVVVAIRGENSQENNIPESLKGDRLIQLRSFTNHWPAIKRNRKIKAGTQGALFQNFRVVTVPSNCEGECKAKFKCFVVYRSGKSRLFNDTMKAIRKAGKSAIHLEVIERLDEMFDDDMLDSRKYLKHILFAYLKNVPIKNCYLCKHHTDEVWQGNSPIYCKLHRTTKKSNDAAECSGFSPDPNVFKQHIEYVEMNEGPVFDEFRKNGMLGKL